MPFEIAEKCEKDARVVWQMRADPEVLAASYHSTLPSFNDFFETYLTHYFIEADLPPLFFIEEGCPVAFLRFEPVEDPCGQSRRSALISIMVAKDARGRGVALRLLDQIEESLASKGLLEVIVAEIKKNNTASLSLFIKAGYTPIEETSHLVEETQEEVPIIRLQKPLAVEKLLYPSTVSIVAEIGSNWRLGNLKADITLAKKLIQIAADAGCNAVKFQTFRPETLYAKGAGKASYLSGSSNDYDMDALFRQLAMPYEVLPELSLSAKEAGLEFMSTPFSEEDFCAVDPYVKRHKIASYEITDPTLIEMAARSKKPLILSTGAATPEEIDWAVRRFRSLGGIDLTLLQCVAAYPAPLDETVLRALPLLSHRFGVKVGLSDHTKEPLIAPLGAVALGASLIEKHITLSKNLPGPDHAFALTPDELFMLVQSIRNLEKCLRYRVKDVMPSERDLRSFAQRGLQATAPIKRGEPIILGKNCAFLRPGNQTKGVHPRSLTSGEPQVVAKREISQGEGICLEDLT